MKKKMNHFFVAGRDWLFVAVLILPLASCSFFGLPEYELSITVAQSVNGTPVSSVQVLPELTKIEYAYTPVNSLHTVEVITNGGQGAETGTVTMYTNITLVARLIDIRADWNISLHNSDSTAIDPFTITFSGADILAGTFSDSRGYSGTWDAASNKININYSNWESYKLTGTLFSMNGTWSNGAATGSWGAKRE
ncbi:MAG: hypothetical protein L6428_01995 [Candidatus Aminicenantes bacterium]|nr:hypothetical protein [Candidatus Aminicenantes bacterium]